MEDAQELGRLFEKELADEFELKQTVASGAFWFSKLDLFGIGCRWWLRLTTKRSFRLTQDHIDEAIIACNGPGGDGSVPIWAIRIGEAKYDVILMRKEDFKALIRKEIEIVYEPSKKADINRRKAATPILLREENNEES